MNHQLYFLFSLPPNCLAAVQNYNYSTQFAPVSQTSCIFNGTIHHLNVIIFNTKVNMIIVL